METGCDASLDDGMSIDMHNMAMGLELSLARLSNNPSLARFHKVYGPKWTMIYVYLCDYGMGVFGVQPIYVWEELYSVSHACPIKCF